MDEWEALHTRGLSVVERVAAALSEPQPPSLARAEALIDAIESLSCSLTTHYDALSALFTSAASASQRAPSASALSRGPLGASPSLCDVTEASLAVLSLAEDELQCKDAVLTALRAGLISAAAGGAASEAAARGAPLVVLDTVVPPSAWPDTAADSDASARSPGGQDWSAFPLAWRSQWGRSRLAWSLACSDAATAAVPASAAAATAGAAASLAGEMAGDGRGKG